MLRSRLTLFLGLSLATLAGAPLLAAPAGRSVATKTIIVPGGDAFVSASAPTEAASPPGDTAPATPPAAGAPTPPTGDAPAPSEDATPDQPKTPGAVVIPDENDIPVVEYDLAKLPEPVRRLREQIIAAAATGDPEKLRPIIEANGEPPVLSLNDVGDPITFIKSLSGDPEGREILAILTEVLEAGYLHVDVGTPDEVYLWPYFARYPVDKLNPRQLVELFKLVYAGDYEDMKAYGSYSYYRVGIAPNGSWKFFIAGD